MGRLSSAHAPAAAVFNAVDLATLSFMRATRSSKGRFSTTDSGPFTDKALGKRGALRSASLRKNWPSGCRLSVQSGLMVGLAEPHTRPSTVRVPAQWVSTTQRLSRAPSTWTAELTSILSASREIRMSARLPVRRNVTP